MKKKLGVLVLLLALLVSYPGSLMLNSFQTSFAFGLTITVTDAGDSGTNTLRDAISTANGSATNVLINFDPSVTTINLNSSLQYISIEDGSITIDGANQLTITKSLSFVGNGYGFKLGNELPVNNSTSNIIRNLVLDGFENGVIVYGDNNRVENVTIKGPSVGASCNNLGQHGISIVRRSIYDVIGNTILNNTVTCYRKGIFVQNPSGTTISGNTVTNNTSTVDLTGSQVFNDVNPCFVAGIEIQGFYTLGSAPLQKNFITNNEVTNNGFETAVGPCASLPFRSAGIILDLYGDTASSHDTPAHLNRIANNEITDNVGDGISVFQAYQNEIISNHIARNGSVPAVGDAPSDKGNGISLFCTEGGISGAVTTGNLMYRNTIEHNADNGIFVGKLCEVTGTPTPSSNSFNPIIENTIYENGRVSGTADSSNDDGIGIDLQDQFNVSVFSYTTGNTNINENDAALTDGGNEMADTPVITSAAYNPGSSTWTVNGTQFIPPSGSVGSMVELYQVGCASNNLPTDLNTCDLDTYPGAPHTYGYGQGRIFLGRTYTTTSEWVINIPSSTGFAGGLITATNTMVSGDPSCVTPPTVLGEFVGGVGNALCSTSEFSANFLAQAPTPAAYSGTLTKLITPQSIVRGGTGTTILSFTNTGNDAFTTVDISDVLSTPNVDYVAGTCSWAINTMPVIPGNCDFVADTINLSGFSSLAPGQSLHITFDFTVPLLASLGSHINTASATVTPATAITPSSATFKVTDVPAPIYTGAFSKIVAPSSIATSGTGTTILTFTNTGNERMTAVAFTDDLSAVGVEYVPSSCHWNINSAPINTNECHFSFYDIIITGFTGLAPGETVYVTFDFVVPTDASIGTHVNTVFITTTPGGALGSTTANFEVTSTPAPVCTTTGTSVDATFTANGVSHGPALEMYPGDLLLANSNPTQGDDPVDFNWVVDGTSQGTGNQITLNLSVGNHAVTHVISDCDGSYSVSTIAVTIKNLPAAPVNSMTLHKSISPAANLHVGDLVTVVVQVENPLTSTGFTTIDLADDLSGLSNLVPVCNYSVGSMPSLSSDTCNVTTGGQIPLDLSATPLDIGQSLFIRYVAVVTGTPAVYHDAVGYQSSVPPVSPDPVAANADFTVVAAAPGGPVCTTTNTVDASFTINGQPTPTQLITANAGTYNLVNDSTSGDSPVVSRWYVNGELQSESAGTLTRAITESTTFTLLKVDCDGSAALDTLTVFVSDISVPPTPDPTVSPSPTTTPTPTATPTTTPSPTASPTPSASPTVTPVPTVGFTVDKEIMNPVALYTTDSPNHTIKIKSTIHNTGSATSLYTFTDPVSNVFMPIALVNDSAGGTNESIPGLIKVSAISIPAQSSKAVIYTLTIKSDTDFPLSTYHLDSNAASDDGDFYPVRIKTARLGDTSNDDPDNLLDAPDGIVVNLGERGSVVLDLGKDKLLVDGDGDDLAIALTKGKIMVAASQDGRSFQKLRGTTTFDLADADMTWARYIKITDNSVDAFSTANVDAVCLLNLGVGVSDTSQVSLASDNRTNAVAAYIDVTSAFGDSLSSSDCRSPKTAVAKQARTIELEPPAPVAPYVPTPIVTPVAPVISEPIPVVQLPKTGPENVVIVFGATLLAALLFRSRLVSKRLTVKVTDGQVGRK